MYPLSLLLKPVEPWVLQSTASVAVVSEEVERLLRTVEGVKMLTLDGASMETIGGFYDEMVRGLQLPAYFGRNLNALDECLCDLDWLSATGYVLLVCKAEKVLRTEPAETFDGFLSVLNSAGREWAQPVQDGEVWDRPPRPFHMIFLCGSPAWRKDIPLLQHDSTRTDGES